MTWAAKSVSQKRKVGAGGTALLQLATLTAERSNTLAPCSESADALNSGVSGEGAQDITDHYPNPKGAKRWATKRSPAKRLAHFG